VSKLAVSGYRVKDSDNPRMFEAYLAKYPAGEFISLAEIKLQSLSDSQEGLMSP
jgi:hypothetical protein